MKLPNGFGSVYKLPGNRRKPWVAKKTTGWDENGKQLYYTIGYFETRSKAMTALVEYNKNPIAERRDITLGELYEEWSKDRYPKISPKTVESYKAAWNHLLILKEERFKDIKTSHIQKVINDMAEIKKLSHSSCHKVKVLAGLLYQYALADDIVDKNYAEFVNLPPSDTKEKEIFTDFEIGSIANLAKTDKWAKAVLILIYTGMRIGELLNHTKFTVDIENMLFLGGNKTEAGKKKIIPVHLKIQECVMYWYAQGGSYFISRNSTKIKVDYFRKYLYYPTLEKAGVRKLTPHSTRHTFANLMNRAGVDKTYQQKLIGHANYSTTANIYTHPDIEELRKAIGMIS